MNLFRKGRDEAEQAFTHDLLRNLVRQDSRNMHTRNWLRVPE